MPRFNPVYILLLATLILFVSKSLYNIPIGIMAVAGLFLLLKAPILTWQNPTIRIFIILFLCLWVPLLISLIDAVNLDHSSKSVISYLRFLFMGIYVIHAVGKPKVLSKLNILIFCIVGFWCVDGLIQYLFKTNLFGYPYTHGYVTGLFYPNLTIGHITAALSPLYFDSIRVHSNKHRWLWIMLIPLFAVILLSGRRAAWIMLAVSNIGYLFYYLKLHNYDVRLLKKVCLFGGIVFVSLGLIIASNQPLQKRLQTTANIFSGDYELADIATARRLPLWETSLNIFRNNWINGVGPRGFRYVYQQYSDADNYWYTSGQTHPHQLILEVLAETGTIGFSGLLLFSLFFYRYIKAQDLGMPLFPWLLAIVVVIFPLNTHMAFYGSYWSSMFWWLMAITFAAARIQLTENKKSIQIEKVDSR
ncbi:MAG: O-antigen ligase [Gammaproteobacteria bacterium]